MGDYNSYAGNVLHWKLIIKIFVGSNKSESDIRKSRDIL